MYSGSDAQEVHQSKIIIETAGVQRAESKLDNEKEERILGLEMASTCSCEESRTPIDVNRVGIRRCGSYPSPIAVPSSDYPCDKEFVRSPPLYVNGSPHSPESLVKMSPLLSALRDAVTSVSGLEDFEKLERIGAGFFAEVFKVRMGIMFIRARGYPA